MSIPTFAVLVKILKSKCLRDSDTVDGVTSQNSLILLYVLEGSALSILWNFQFDPITFLRAKIQNTDGIFDSDLLIDFQRFF